MEKMSIGAEALKKDYSVSYLQRKHKISFSEAEKLLHILNAMKWERNDTKT